MSTISSIANNLSVALCLKLIFIEGDIVMAIIMCPECGKNVSDKAAACIHCGYPLQKIQGKVIIKASNAFIGLAGKYNIYDSHNNKLGSIKSGELWEIDINEDTVLLVKYNGAFRGPQEIKCYADQINKFAISIQNGGFAHGFSVSKVDVIDSD